jgi:hypothetical protein
MKSVNYFINNINQDERLSSLFIIVTVSTIIGDEFIKKYYKCRNIEDYKNAKKCFIIGILITLFVYLIFIKKNKRDYYEKIMRKSKSFPSFVRLVGSILLAIGTICLLYFQITDTSITDGPLI